MLVGSSIPDPFGRKSVARRAAPCNSTAPGAVPGTGRTRDGVILEPRMKVANRQLIAAALVGFTTVVSASFAYGFLLLYRGPKGLREGAEGHLAPLPPDVRALLERSAAAMKKGEVEQAILGYRRVLTLGPSLEALLGLAEGESRAGRGPEATAEYERALRLEPGNARALLPLARAYADRRESWEQSEARYREYLAQVPGDAEA